MYILINNNNVYYNKDLKKINKKLGTEFKPEDFKSYNSNHILNVNNDDLDFKRDIHELEKVFVRKLYKKDASNLINYAFYVIMLIMILMTLSGVSGTSGMLSELIDKGVLIK